VSLLPQEIRTLRTIGLFSHSRNKGGSTALNA
jgi:hypothetical protein